MDKYLSTKDVQEILQIGRNKVYKLIQQNDFPKIKIGRNYLIPEAEFEKYLHRKLYKTIEVQARSKTSIILESEQQITRDLKVV